MAEPIRVEIQATDVKFRNTLKRAEIFARDTKKKLEKPVLIDLELNVAQFQVQLDRARQDLREAKKQGDKDAEINARLRTNELQRNLTEAKRQLNNYTNTGDKNLSRLQAKFNSVNKTIERQGSIMRDVIGRIFSGDFRGAIESFSDGVRELNSNVGESGRSASTANTSFGLLGSTFQSTAVIVGGLVALLGSLAVALGKASRNAISFESAFAGVRKTVDASEEVIQSIRKDILELSKEIPSTVEELSKIGELGGQLGIAPEKLSSFIKTVAQLGVTTNLATEDAATALARVANITSLTQEEFDNFGSALVELGNNFATTERDIIEFTERISGAGQIAGLAPSQILALATAFSSVGIEAEAGGSAVQKVLLRLNSAVQAGGVELEKFSAVAGLTSEQFANQFEKDAGQAFALFVDGLSKSGKQASQILESLELSDVRLQRAFLSLAQNSDLLTDAINRGNKAFADNNALSKEAIIRFGTAESRLQLLRNEWRVFSITVGDAFNKVFIPLLIKANKILTSESFPIVVEFGRLLSSIFRRIKPLIETFFIGPLRTLGVFIQGNLTLFTGLFRTLTNLINGDTKSAFKSFGATAANVLGSLQNLINSVISNVNLLIGLLNKIPGVSFSNIGPSKIGDKLTSRFGLSSFLGEAERIKKIQATKLGRFDPNAVLDEVNSRFGTGKNPLDDLLSQLDDIDAAAGGGGGKVKELKEETDELFDVLNERAGAKTQLDRLKESLEENDKAMERVKEQGEITFSALGDAVEESQKKIERFNSEVEKIDTDIAGIDKDLGSRYIEIRNEIDKLINELRAEDISSKDEKDLQEKIDLLRQEKDLIEGNVDSEILAEARRQSRLSETEKLLERRDQLEEEKKQLVERITFEIEQQERLAEKKKELEERFTEVYGLELEKQTDKFKQEVERRIRAYRSLQSEQSGGGATNVQNTQNNTFNVNNNVDLESALNQRIIKGQNIF